MRATWILAICGVVLGCDRGAPAPVVETPARQFTFEGLQIEERRQGRVVWSGQARRADGDLGEADVEELSAVIPPRSEGGTQYYIRAPRGRITFEEQATFHDVRITDPAGGSLAAATAQYLEAEREIRAEGPLEFAARGLQAHATRAVLHLEEGTIDIEGPVEGRFEPPRDAPAAPRP